MDAGAGKSVNSFGKTAEQAREGVVESAKRTIDEYIDKVHTSGKQPDGTWGIRLSGSGNFQSDTYMPYLELRNSDAEEGAKPEIIQLTSSPVSQEESGKLEEYYFQKVDSLEN